MGHPFFPQPYYLFRRAKMHAPQHPALEGYAADVGYSHGYSLPRYVADEPTGVGFGASDPANCFGPNDAAKLGAVIAPALVKQIRSLSSTAAGYIEKFLTADRVAALLLKLYPKLHQVIGVAKSSVEATASAISSTVVNELLGFLPDSVRSVASFIVEPELKKLSRTLAETMHTYITSQVGGAVPLCQPKQVLTTPGVDIGPPKPALPPPINPYMTAWLATQPMKLHTIDVTQAKVMLPGAPGYEPPPYETPSTPPAAKSSLPLIAGAAAVALLLLR